MKRIIIISLVTGFFFTLGCEKFPVGNAFLEKAPGVDVTQDTVFSTLDYAERFLWNAYFWLPYGLDQTETGLGMKMEHELLQDITDLSHSKMGWGGSFWKMAKRGSGLGGKSTTLLGFTFAHLDMQDMRNPHSNWLKSRT